MPAAGEYIEENYASLTLTLQFFAVVYICVPW